MTQIPECATIGKFAVIEEGVTMGKGITIGHHSVILRGTVIGDHITIGSHCVIGIQPVENRQIRRSQSHQKELVIRDHVQIGSHVTLYLGSTIAEEVFIADQVSIRENVSIGKRSVIGRGAMIELNSIIGANCTIQTLAYITGDTTLEDNVFIGPCVSMSNDKYMRTRKYTLQGPFIEQGARIGNNATLLPGVRIGKNAIVGAGSVVTRDVGEQQTVIGVPARELKISD